MTVIEERHVLPGALRALGGVGGSRSATACPGRSERGGVWGAMSGPLTCI